MSVRTSGKPDQQPPESAGVESLLYICPMPAHVSIAYDHPGACPICHMDLVLRKADQAPSESAVPDHAIVTISPDRRQLIGMQTGVAERKPFQQVIRAAATVQYNEKTLSAVNLKVNGWVEELKAVA